MAERECRTGLRSDVALNFNPISETLITSGETQNYDDDDHGDDEQEEDDDEDDDDGRRRRMMIEDGLSARRV